MPMPISGRIRSNVTSAKPASRNASSQARACASLLSTSVPSRSRIATQGRCLRITAWSVSPSCCLRSYCCGTQTANPARKFPAGFDLPVQPLSSSSSELPLSYDSSLSVPHPLSSPRTPKPRLSVMSLRAMSGSSSRSGGVPCLSAALIPIPLSVVVRPLVPHRTSCCCERSREIRRQSGLHIRLSGMTLGWHGLLRPWSSSFTSYRSRQDCRRFAPPVAIGRSLHRVQDGKARPVAR